MTPATQARPCEHLVRELPMFRNQAGVRVSCPRQCGCPLFAVIGEFGRATLHRHGPDAAAIVGEINLRDDAMKD